MADRIFPEENLSTRTLGATGLFPETPGAQFTLAGRTAQNVSQSVPNVLSLSAQIKSLLAQYQQFGSAQEAQGIQEQVRRGTAPLPADLAGAQLSPSQILGFRKGEVGAVEPTIGGARGLVKEAETATSRLQDFLQTYEANKLKALTLQQQQESQLRDDARSLFNAAIGVGSKAVEGLISKDPDIIKNAGFNKETAQFFFEGLKNKEAVEAKKAQEVSAGRASLEASRKALEELRRIQLRRLTEVSTGQLVNKATGVAVTETGPLVTQTANLRSIQDISGYIRGRLEEGIQTGAIKGWITYKGLTIPALQETLDPDQVELQADIITLFTQYVYAMTGAQVNELEFELASKKSPSIMGTTENNIRLLDSFDRGINTKLNAILTTKGWSFGGGAPQSQTGNPQTLKVGDKTYILQPNGKYIQQ